MKVHKKGDVKPEPVAAVLKPTKQNLPAVGPEVRTGTEVALPTEWEMELAQAAKDETAVETTDMQAFSIRAGVLSYNGQPMPENKMNVIVVSSAFEKSMFISKFDPNNITPPLCFALSPDGDEMEPHENSFMKQGNEDKDSESFGKCHGCPQLEWGSDPGSPSGRGKMCKETRRLGLLSYDALADGVEKANAAMIRIPVTSVANWASYVHLLSATLKRPAWSVITEISVHPHVKNQMEVKFTPIGPINDVRILKALQDMRGRVQTNVMNPYALMTKEQFDEIQAEKNRPQKKAKF